MHIKYFALQHARRVVQQYSQHELDPGPHLKLVARFWICWFRYSLCGRATLKEELGKGKGREILSALGITYKVPVRLKGCPLCFYTTYTSVSHG